MFNNKIALLVPLLLLSCTSSKEFTGFSYDPPGVADTKGAPVADQIQKSIGIGEPKVWVSNQYESARLTDFTKAEGDTFIVNIRPENAPINNSPWYSFEIWSEKTQTVTLRLNYGEARHRYVPKIYTNGTWYPLSDVNYDEATDDAIFDLMVSPVRKTVSAHVLNGITFSDLEMSFFNELPDFVNIKTAGYSVQDRPVYQLITNEVENPAAEKAVILLSRQHPPEVSGYRTFLEFYAVLNGDSDLAKEFRKSFSIYAFPVVNPDGVVNGHWRHNAMGVDLNRDWEPFNQPETRAVRDALTELEKKSDLNVVYGIDFHSTNENIFYPINEEVKTEPDNFTQEWYPFVAEQNPELNFSSEEFDTSSPISKNWLYKTFGCDALTYEVDDELTDSQIQQLGETSAVSFMKLMLERYVK